MITTNHGHPAARLIRLLVRPFKEEFGDIFDRLKRRTELVDLTAVATNCYALTNLVKVTAINLVMIPTFANKRTRDAEIPMPTLARAAKSQRCSSNSSPHEVAGDLRLD
jgi:hypothetical protein